MSMKPFLPCAVLARTSTVHPRVGATHASPLHRPCAPPRRCFKALATQAAATFGLALALVSASTVAEQILPEIVVTAQLRTIKLLEDSSSTSVLTEDTIRQQAAQHLQDLLNLAPNVNFSGGTSRARYFQLRGIGERSQFQEPLNPSVGLLLDGVDFSGIGAIGTMFDIQQVEILRGPQGTLHGANALAGLINIRSNQPSQQPQKRIDLGLADYASWHLGVLGSGPLSETLGYRLALQQYRSDGFTENEFLGRDDTGERDELTLRGRLSWEISGRHHLDMTLTQVDIDNGYDAFSLDNERSTLSDEPGRDEQQSAAVAATLASSYRNLDTELLLTYADTETDYNYDEDWTFAGFHPYGYSSHDRYQRQRDSYSAQLRLLSNERSRLFNDALEWLFGLYYLANEEDLKRSYTYLGQDFLSQYDTSTLALFGQMDLQLNDHMGLVAGLRTERRKTEYSDNNGVGFDPEQDLWGGKLALEYSFSDAGMLYGSISRGYRANGVNAEILASIDSTDDPAIQNQLRAVREYDEEALINYELGLKGQFAQRRLGARLALFYMDREDQQVKGSFLIRQADGGTSFTDYTDNAARGNHYGMELELNWLPLEPLSLWLNLGLLQTEYENYVNADGIDLSGRDQPHAPRYQFAAGGRYRFGSGLYLQAGLEGKDGFYFSDRHDANADSYELLNAALGYRVEAWELTLWGRNLTDQDYYVRGFGSFGNDPRKDYATEPYYQYGDPRLIGVSASYKF